MPGQIMLTFRQYIESVHLALHVSSERAAMAYAAGSAITVSVALLVELVIIYHGLPRGRQRVGRAFNPPQRPLVSVIVPTYGDGNRLLRAVSSLLSQDYPKELYEVVIAGEADDPLLPNALRSLGLRAEDGFAGLVSGVRVRVSLGTSHGGKPAALNRALNIASGDVIGVLDSDDVAPADAISRAVAALLSGYSAAQLQREVEVPEWARRGLLRAYVRGQSAEMKLYNKVLAPALMGFAGTSMIIGSGYFVWRWALDEVGGWSPYAPTEDIDLTVRLMASGLRIAFLPGPPVVEEPLTSIRAVIRQKERWVRGALLATYTALRGIRRTWPLILILIMPAWGYLMTPWLALLALAALSPQLAEWTLEWSAVWLIPATAYYFLALRRGGKALRPLPAIVALYMLAGVLALPKLAVRRYEWRGSRT